MEKSGGRKRKLAMEKHKVEADLKTKRRTDEQMKEYELNMQEEAKNVLLN